MNEFEKAFVQAGGHVIGLIAAFSLMAVGFIALFIVMSGGAYAICALSDWTITECPEWKASIDASWAEYKSARESGR